MSEEAINDLDDLDDELKGWLEWVLTSYLDL
jgi:hypothetical protein